MEVFIIIAMSAGLFTSGMSLGAYLENKRVYSVKLVEEIKKYAKQLNIDTVSLFVFAKNSSAVNAYEKMGFETEGLKMTLT